MPLDKSKVFNLLKRFDEEATRKIVLVAVGGTAMTLLDLKPSTMGIDFTGPRKDLDEFDRIRNSVPHGFKIDAWPDGTVFCTTLPDDYLDRSISIVGFEKILLRALHPLDIVVTKIGRLDRRDVQDIGECIRKYGISREDLERRAASVIYVSREEDYRYNLQWALREFYA
jgi:hypothetical protein